MTKVLRQTALVFLQSVPIDVDLEELDQDLHKVHQVMDVHDTHLWSLDGDYHVCSTHIVAVPHASIEEIGVIKQEVREIIHHRGVHHATIEIEFPHEPCGLKDC